MRRLRQHHRLGRCVALVTTMLGALLGHLGVARAAEFSFYEGSAQGSVMSFVFHAPQAVFPFSIVGGALESTVQSAATPQAFGVAGIFPVPLASSAGLIVPQVVPILGTPIPEDVRDAFKSFDFTNTPYYCQAAFPPVTEGGDETYCGGPAQRDTALGFTSATANGHVRASGDFEQPLRTRTLAESRAEDASVPGLQATVRKASSRAVSGLNGDGVPQSEARAEIGLVDLLGKAVTLRDLTSDTAVTSDGTTKGTAGSTHLTLGSASVLGIPVVISPEGFTLAGQALPGVTPQSLAEMVNKAAHVQDFSLRLVPAQPVADDKGIISAQSGAVELSYTTGTPTPLRVIQYFGHTRASLNTLAMDAQGPPSTDGVGLSNVGPTATPFSDSVDSSPQISGPGTSPVGGSIVSNANAAWLNNAMKDVGSTPLLTGSATANGSARETRGGTTRTVAGNQALLRPILAGPALPAHRVQSLYLYFFGFVLAAAIGFRSRRAMAGRLRRDV
jgi:hypothetical protein